MTTQQPEQEAGQSRRDCIPRVLDAYAEDLERNHVPTDSGLPHSLRFAASMLREMQEVAELLDASGEAIGNEHRRYAFIERVRNLITSKNYAWRKRDEYEAWGTELRGALLLVAESNYDSDRKIKDVPAIRKLLERNYL